MGALLFLPAQVCWEPKTVLKNTVYLLKCFETYRVLLKWKTLLIVSVCIAICFLTLLCTCSSFPHPWPHLFACNLLLSLANIKGLTAHKGSLPLPRRLSFEPFQPRFNPGVYILMTTLELYSSAGEKLQQCFLFVLFFFPTLNGMWDLSSPSKD